MRRGFSKANISPAKMTPMAGFDLRTETAAGVHDPLAVRALLIEDGIQTTALLVYDLLGVPMYLKERLEQEAALPLGMKTLTVCAIHTHAAPKTHFRSFAVFDPSYEDLLVEAGTRALQQAEEDLAPASLILDTKQAPKVASFRDGGREAAAFTMPVDVLTFLREEKTTVSLYVIRTHPTVLNEKNLFMSRDLVYGMDQALLKEDPKAENIFLNGACADISTRYTRRESSFEEVLRLGEVFAKALQEPSERKAEGAGEGVKALSRQVFIPPAQFFDAAKREEILAYLEEKILTCQDPEEKREYISCRSVLQRPLYGKTPDGRPKEGETVELLVLRLPVADLIFLPFEYAFKDERILKETAEKLTQRPAIVVCYANGYEGYLPSGKPLSKDSGYEDMASSYRFDAKEIVKEAVLIMLRELPKENEEGK